MRFNLSLLVLLSAAMLLGCNSKQNEPASRSANADTAVSHNVIRMMTYNVKYDDENDPVNGWDQRKNNVVGLLRYHQPDIVGTQEAEHHQLEYIRDHLHQYKWFGEGRDGGNEGEFSAVFYNHERFELLNDTTLWLSPTPGEQGMGWDAAFPRIVTVGLLKNKNTKQQIHVFNTHYDHVGQVARRNSSVLLHRFISELSTNKSYILMGDFNATPESEPYNILVNPADSINNKVPLADTYTTSVTPHYGPPETYSGFDVKEPERRIDYIFSSPDFMVLRHATLTDFEDMRFHSDHLPVVADVVLKR